MTFAPAAQLDGGVAMGAGTFYEIDADGIGGLGVPVSKTAEMELDGRDGSYAAPDFLGVRLLTIPINILADPESDDDGPTDAGNKLTALNDDWAPARDGVDRILSLTLPWATLGFIGRARGVEVVVVDLKGGVITAVCRFDATAPNAISP